MITLDERIAQSLAAPVKDAVREFAVRLAEEQGALAVLFYGSNLRTGELEGVLDFYVLRDGKQSEQIWPRVSYHEWQRGEVTLRAKVATMTLAKFAEAASGDSRDTTIWARFVQPSVLIWSRDQGAEVQLRGAIAEAAKTAARLAVALGPTKGQAEDYWRALFRETYKAEFRVERAGREDSILSVNQAHFDGLLPLALTAQAIDFAQDGAEIEPNLSDTARKRILRWWARRKRWGKALNLVRLVKASTTFEGAARYAAWKVERHTGVEVEVTPWREKHPILAAPGVLWRVWRHRRAEA